MTNEQWLTLAAPILSALALGIVGIIGAVFTGLTARTRAWLDAKGQAEAGEAVTLASNRLQAAAANAAGQIALKVQTGQLDPTSWDAIRGEAVVQAREIERKMAESIGIANVVDGAILGAVLGKVVDKGAAALTGALADVATQAGRIAGPVKLVEP